MLSVHKSGDAQNVENPMDTTSHLRTNFHKTAALGMLVFVLLFGGVGFWLVYVNVAGAVIASGTVIVKGKPKSIQHLDGGIVQAIHVHNGQQITKGDVLVQLDDTLLHANFEIYKNRLGEASARKDRLEAERDNRRNIKWTTSRSSLLQQQTIQQHRIGQTKLFMARRASRLGQKSQLHEQLNQFRNQIKGIQGVKFSKEHQVRFIEQELHGVEVGYREGLLPLTRVLTLQRDRADLFGQISEHDAELARIENSIRETEITILQHEREFQEKVLSELREVTPQVNELRQQILATQEQIERIDVKAPVSGVIHELNIFTIGGVVPPGGTIMQVIAQNDGVEIEVNVEPQYIDQMFIGQEAAVRFAAFNQRTTPEISGHVSFLSPSSVVDEQSGLSFYRIGIGISDEQIARLGDKILVPGMPVEAFMKTNDRPVISYLLKPLTDHIYRAFREE